MQCTQRSSGIVTDSRTKSERINKALTGGKATDLTAISDKLDQFQQAPNDTALETETCKTTLLQLMMKVPESSQAISIVSRWLIVWMD